MKVLTIGDKEYTLEYSFAAAECKDCVEKVFKMISGSYIGRHGAWGNEQESKSNMAEALADGTASMYAELPDTVITAFYAGLKENNAVMNKTAAKDLLKQYFKENSEIGSFWDMFDLIKKCMEEDGFFKLTGMDKMLEEINQAAKDAAEKASETNQSESKKTTNSKKKSVSTN